jgi:hypothetical protein
MYLEKNSEKKCEKSVPGKKIVKKSVKKVYPEKIVKKKCEKSVPGKRIVKKVYLEKE